MNITIDTEKKIIKLHRNILVNDFVTELANHLNQDLWSDYTLQVESLSEAFPTTGTSYHPNLTLPPSNVFFTHTI